MTIKEAIDAIYAYQGRHMDMLFSEHLELEKNFVQAVKTLDDLECIRIVNLIFDEVVVDYHNKQQEKNNGTR